MNAAELNTLINYKASTNDTTFTVGDKLILVNIFKDEISSKIVETNNGMFLVPTTFNLVKDQREYALDGNLLARVQRLEIKFASGDSLFPAKWIKDYLGSETESEIVKEFSNAKDHFAYLIRRRSVFILSGTIIAVTDGCKMHSYSYPADLANMTDTADLEIDPSNTTFGFPRQFQELLARRVVIERKGSQPTPIPLNEKEKDYDKDLKVLLDSMARVDNSGEILAELPPERDKLMGNSGFDF